MRFQSGKLGQPISVAGAQTIRRVCFDEHGANLVEFALSASIVIGAIFGVLYFSMALYANHFVANAAKDGARYAMVRGSTWSGTSCTSTTSFSCAATSTDISNYVQSTIPPGLTPSDLTVSASWPGTNPAGSACDTANGNNSPYCAVSVNVSYNFGWILPFFPQNMLQLTSTSTVAITE